MHGDRDLPPLPAGAADRMRDAKTVSGCDLRRTRAPGPGEGSDFIQSLATTP